MINIFGSKSRTLTQQNSRFFFHQLVLHILCKPFVRDEFQVMFHELDSDVSLAGINKGIKQLKLSKSAGPDNYLNEYVIHENTVLIPYLQSLFNDRLFPRNMVRMIHCFSPQKRVYQ